ncbi:MAG: hypothetical protein HKM93_10530 [Desulfobacteraceae bacterium]|nr:hypothetical protein [Desulfobacteraceae bacterium]
MKDYDRSSYKGCLPHAAKWNWLYKEFVFSMLTPKKKGRLDGFVTFMHEEDSEKVVRLFSNMNLPSLFGSDSFITGIKETYHHIDKGGPQTLGEW